MKIQLTILLLIVLQVQVAWSQAKVHFHPIRLAYSLASRDDTPELARIPQDNDFLWIKLGIEVPLHGNKSFLLTPRWYSRHFDLSAQEYWSAVVEDRANECTQESKALESCNKYTNVAEGVINANEFDVFELGWETRWFAEPGRRGYFQRVVIITGLAYYQASSYGLIEGQVQSHFDDQVAGVAALMYGIGFQSSGKNFVFSFDSAIGLQLAGPFPDYIGSQQLPIEQDLFRAEFDLALGFQL